MRLLLVATLVSLLLAQPAFAGVGLSPVNINFDKMVRGGYAERYFTVSNPSEEPQDISISVEGSVAGWVSVEPATFTLDSYSFGVFKATIQPPDNVPNGGYSGTLLVVAMPHAPKEIGQITGVSVASAIAASVHVEISDYQVLQYKIEGMTLPDTEECRPIIVAINIRNTGNVRVNPRFVIEITGADGTVVQRHEETTGMILPTVAAAINIRVPYQLSQFGCIPQGRYRADITSYVGDTVMDRSAVFFNIWPRGRLALSGEILELVAPSNTTLGETVRIDCIFKNTGQLPVSAKPTIEVLSGPSLTDTVSGEVRDIGIGGIDKLTAYWKPGLPGKYTLRATATFEGHSTTPVEKLIEVYAPVWWWIAGAAAGAAIVVAFIFFRRGGRRGSRRKRR